MARCDNCAALTRGTTDRLHPHRHLQLSVAATERAARVHVPALFYTCRVCASTLRCDIEDGDDDAVWSVQQPCADSDHGGASPSHVGAAVAHPAHSAKPAWQMAR